MTQEAIHQIFLQAAIEAAKQGASAKELADYLKAAASGMKMNAAFALSGDDLIAALKGEED